jgi:D-apionolactonase
VLIHSDLSFLPARKFSVGPLGFLYEPGKIRYIRSGNSEVLRMIYFALRDHKWDTIPYTIENLTITGHDTHFDISFLALYNSPGISYQAAINISGSANTIEFSFSGTAGSDFLSNRIGICIHHPVDGFTGLPVEILTSRGDTVSATVPETISPQQPFVDLRQLHWTTNEGVSATVKFEGEIFETEDQRNWTDASFKTYCTPLERPFPVATKKGTTINQRVILTLHDGVAQQTQKRANTLRKKSFPPIGYGRGVGQSRLNREEITRFKKIPFDVYRVALKLNDNRWQQIFDDAVFEAGAIGCKIQLAVFFDTFSEGEIRQIVESVMPARELIQSLLILSVHKRTAPADVWPGIYAGLKNALPGIAIGYGTDNYFADLNRNRPGTSSTDFLSFGFHPQVHASDNRSILENLGSQADTLRTIRSFAGDMPVHISPVTFSPEYNPDDPDTPLAADPRQYSAFTSWWMLKMLANVADAKSIVFFQLLGDRGLMRHTPTGYELSAAYQLLEQLKAFDPVFISSHQDVVSEVMLENGAGERMNFITDIPEPGAA